MPQHPLRVLIRSLATLGNGNVDPDLLQKCQKQLKIDSAECNALIARILVVPSHETRESINAQNLLLLMNHAQHLPAATLQDIYNKFLLLIYEAMQATARPETAGRA